MKKGIGFMAIALLFSISLNAQFMISGRVTNEKLNALPGATVQVLNSDLVVVTDNSGIFELTIENLSPVEIEIRFVGYNSKRISVHQNNSKKLHVILKSSMLVSDMVVVKGTRASWSDPISYKQVTKDELEKTNMTQDIPYLLRMTPSLVATSDAGNGIGYTGLRIRGSDPSRINVTINGIPYNDSESHDVYWVDIPDFVSSINSIQVQRGLGTSTNGAAAFGANINIQTKALSPNPYAELNSSVGSFNTIKNTFSAGTGLINDNFTVDFRLSDLRSDGYIDRAFSKMRSYYLTAAWYSGRSIIKFSGFQGSELTYQAWGGVPSELLQTNRTYNPYTYENEVDDYQQNHYQLHWAYELNSSLNVNLALHYTRGHGFYEQYKGDEDFEDYLLNDISTANDTISSTDLVRRKWLDNHFYGAIYNVNYTNDKLVLQFGGGLNQYDGDHFGRIIWAQFASNSTPEKNYYYSNGLKTDANSFAKVNYGISKRLNLYADVQYRFIDYRITGVDDDQRDLTQDHLYSFFNPKAGIVFNLSELHRAFASIGIGNREPKRSNFTDARPDQVINPERMADLELGYSFKTSKVQTEVNLYYMDYKDQLVLTGEINDVGSAIMINVPDSYRAGLEMELGLSLLKNLNWSVNTTISRNKIKNFTEYVDDWDTWGQQQNELGETDLAFSPGLIAASQLQWNPIPDLSVSLSSKYVGSQYVDNTSDPTRMLEAYFLNDILIAYSPKVNGNLNLRIYGQVNNILNHMYESNAWVYSYYYQGDRSQMMAYYPQAGRNFLIGLQIGF